MRILLTNRCTFAELTSKLRKISASLFAPALHPTPVAIPPFSRSDSDNNLDDNDSAVETEHEWFDESLFAGLSQDVSSNTTEVIAIDVRLFYFFFFLFSLRVFVEAIVAGFGFACSCFSQCRS